MRSGFAVAIIMLATFIVGCSNMQQNKQLPPDPVRFQNTGRVDDFANLPSAEQAKLRSQYEATRTMADYLGLKLGRHWQYLGEGNEFASFTAEVTHTKDRMFQLEENNGGTIIARVIALRPDGVYEVVTQGEHQPGQNLLSSTDAGSSRKTDKKLLPWPLRKGVKWTLPDGSRAEVLSTNESRRVPYGRVSRVVHIRITTAQQAPVANPTGRTTGAAPISAAKRKVNAVTDVYYARGIGLVERSFSIEGSKVTSKLQRLKMI